VWDDFSILPNEKKGKAEAKEFLKGGKEEEKAIEKITRLITL